MSRGNNFRKRLLIERLETRDLLSGNVTAALAGGSLLLTGDTLSDDISINGAATPGQLVVQGLNGTTVNGSASYTAGGVTGDIDVAFLDGSDQLVVGNATSVTVNGSLSVKMGDGAGDRVCIGSAANTGHNGACGGCGGQNGSQSVVTVGAGKVAGDDDLNIKLGNGAADVVSVGGSTTIANDLSIVAGNGNGDQVDIGSAANAGQNGGCGEQGTIYQESGAQSVVTVGWDLNVLVGQGAGDQVYIGSAANAGQSGGCGEQSTSCQEGGASPWSPLAIVCPSSRAAAPETKSTSGQQSSRGKGPGAASKAASARIAAQSAVIVGEAGRPAAAGATNDLNISVGAGNDDLVVAGGATSVAVESDIGTGRGNGDLNINAGSGAGDQVYVALAASPGQSDTCGGCAKHSLKCEEGSTTVTPAIGDDLNISVGDGAADTIRVGGAATVGDDLNIRAGNGAGDTVSVAQCVLGNSMYLEVGTGGGDTINLTQCKITNNLTVVVDGGTGSTVTVAHCVIGQTPVVDDFGTADIVHLNYAKPKTFDAVARRASRRI